MDEVMQFKQMVVWDKGPMGMGWHYRRSYETILVAQKGSGKTRWYDRSRRVENVIRPGDYGIRKIIPRADQHPTEKPAALASYFMRLHSEPGHAVPDPFLGSGSTAVAAVRLGCRFIGIEIDATDFQTAVERIRAGTGRPNRRKTLPPIGVTEQRRGTKLSGRDASIMPLLCCLPCLLLAFLAPKTPLPVPSVSGESGRRRGISREIIRARC